MDVYTLACERTEYLFDTHDRSILSFSGGKDSTVVLNIALEVAHSHPRFERHLPLRVVFYDEEAIPFETEEYVQRVSRRDDVALEWYCLPVKHRNACSRRSPYWWPWAPEDRDRWCRPLPPEALTSLAGFPIDPPAARLSIPDADCLFFTPADGNAVRLMGIRAQESLMRRRAVTWRAVDNYITKVDREHSPGNLYKAYPIYDWSTEDVWTAAKLRGWDVNAAYDRLEMAGVSAGMQRCSPAFGEEPLQKIHTYAECFPDVWEKMVDRVPGVGAAYRYALTELYGYKQRPDKPAGMPWPEFILHYVNKYEPERCAYVAGRVRMWIVNHYHKTTHPILPTALHPDSGLSWDFLLKVAMRGDFKTRQQAGYRIHTLNDGTRRAHPRQWRSYAAELARVIAEGTGTELAHPGPLPDPDTVIPAYARDPDLKT